MVEKRLCIPQILSGANAFEITDIQVGLGISSNYRPSLDCVLNVGTVTTPFREHAVTVGNRRSIATI
jgi:hypothetical protein